MLTRGKVFQMIQSDLVNRFIWFNKNNQFKRMICSPFSRNSEIMIVSYQIHLYTFRTDYTAGVTWKWLMLLCCAFEALEEELTIEWHYMNSNEQDHLAKIHNLCSERKRRVVWTMCGWMRQWLSYHFYLKCPFKCPPVCMLWNVNMHLIHTFFSEHKMVLLWQGHNCSVV